MTIHNVTQTGSSRKMASSLVHTRKGKQSMHDLCGPQLVVDRELAETAANPCVSQFFTSGGLSVAAHDELKF